MILLLQDDPSKWWVPHFLPNPPDWNIFADLSLEALGICGGVILLFLIFSGLGFTLLGNGMRFIAHGKKAQYKPLSEPTVNDIMTERQRGRILRRRRENDGHDDYYG